MILRLIFLQLFFIFNLFCNVSSDHLIKRDHIIPLKTSVIIPCCKKHFKYLPDLLLKYAEQTSLPDEIVVSLSAVGNLKKEEINALENSEFPFDLIIIRHEGNLVAGENRNSTCKQVNGDIILCQDADDLPHPQRVEIVKYFFERYEIDHMMHAFIFPYQDISLTYNIESLHLIPCITHAQAIAIATMHNGNACMTKEVAQTLKWDSERGQDVRFNEKVYNRFKHNVVIKEPLLIYRRLFSSWMED